MKLNLKSMLFLTATAVGILFSTNVYAQSTSEGCSTTSAESTSGCSPTSCRGAQTKFGEAKVISDLRLDLISLKTDMEKSKSISFEARSYDIHNIVGETDDESLQIIVRELKIAEADFAEKIKFKTDVLILPGSKAKQVSYLSNRIQALKKTLLARL